MEAIPALGDHRGSSADGIRQYLRRTYPSIKLPVSFEKKVLEEGVKLGMLIEVRACNFVCLSRLNPLLYSLTLVHLYYSCPTGGGILQS